MFQRSLGAAATAAVEAAPGLRRQCLSTVAGVGGSSSGVSISRSSSSRLGASRCITRRPAGAASLSSLARAVAVEGGRQQQQQRLQPQSYRLFSTEPALQNAANPPAPEAPIPPPAEDKGDGAPPAASPKVAQLSEEILSLNMLELGQLLKVLKHRLGLTDADLRGVAVVAPGAGAAGAGAEAAAEEKPAEKDAFDLKLVSFDDKSKIKVIKEVRTISGLGLKEAKELVEGAPKVIKKEVKKEEAEKLVAKLKEVGAVVELV